MFILLLFFSSSSLVQNDAQSQKLLRELFNAVHKNEPFSVNFTMRTFLGQSSLEAPRSLTGKIRLKGNKFYLETIETNIWFDGKNQWTWQKKSKEVNLTRPNEQLIQELNSSNIFNYYLEKWICKCNGKKKGIHRKIVQKIELISRLNPSNQIIKIFLQMDQKKILPLKIQFFSKKKIKNVIYLSGYQLHKCLPDQYFVFDKKKFPYLKIIDLR